MRTHEGVYQVSTLPHHLAPHFPFMSCSPHFSDQEHRIQKSHCLLSAPISGQRSHVTRQTKRCWRAVLKEEPIVPVYHRDLTRYHHHRDQLSYFTATSYKTATSNSCRNRQLLPRPRSATPPFDQHPSTCEQYAFHCTHTCTYVLTRALRIIATSAAVVALAQPLTSDQSLPDSLIQRPTPHAHFPSPI